MKAGFNAVLLLALGATSVTPWVKPGRYSSRDVISGVMPSVSLGVGETGWACHAPLRGGVIDDFGFTASAPGPGLLAGEATYWLYIDGNFACSVAVPCTVSTGTHVDGSGCNVDVPGGALVEVKLGGTTCLLGDAVQGSAILGAAWR